LLAAVWGWVDQKNEAIGLVRALIDSVSGRLTRTNGVERRELIAAAHSVLVVSAFLETLREDIGKPGWKDLEITDDEIRYLTLGSMSSETSLVEVLYSVEIPAPNAARGFIENEQLVMKLLRTMALRTTKFLNGLVDAPAISEDLVKVALSR
jgi:hypothetical protein